jgi:hypothetical protein
MWNPVANITAAREAQRQRTVNAQTRVDEVRTFLRYSSAQDRETYLVATRAWREAGEPDVPLITRWYAQVPEPDVEVGG